VFLINVPNALIGIACALPLVPDSADPAATTPDLNLDFFRQRQFSAAMS
jgi:hypothetical protein